MDISFPVNINKILSQKLVVPVLISPDLHFTIGQFCFMKMSPLEVLSRKKLATIFKVQYSIQVYDYKKENELKEK